MTGGISIDTESLDRCGKDLENVAADFSSRLQRFQEDLFSFEAPWGHDEIGMLIGAAHEEVLEFAMDCFYDSMDAIQEAGVDLELAAEIYSELEDSLKTMFDQMDDEMSIGGGAW